MMQDENYYGRLTASLSETMIKETLKQLGRPSQIEAPHIIEVKEVSQKFKEDNNIRLILKYKTEFVQITVQGVLKNYKYQEKKPICQIIQERINEEFEPKLSQMELTLLLEEMKLVDTFVVGNLVNKDYAGSLEYATIVKEGCQLIKKCVDKKDNPELIEKMNISEKHMNNKIRKSRLAIENPYTLDYKMRIEDCLDKEQYRKAEKIRKQMIKRDWQRERKEEENRKYNIKPQKNNSY